MFHFCLFYNITILPELEYECVCERLVAGVSVILCCPRELIGCCLGSRSLKAGSAQFLEALLCCPRLPACVIVE